jgi:signal transduction histidine kinase
LRWAAASWPLSSSSASAPISPGLQDALGGAAVLLLTGAMGVIFRYRAQARHQLVEQARLQERENLARELHDTVAHHVSAVAIQAQAGLLLAQKSSLAGAIEALEIINRETAETLAEMRMMVDALRNRDQRAPGHPTSTSDRHRTNRNECR